MSECKWDRVYPDGSVSIDGSVFTAREAELITRDEDLFMLETAMRSIIEDADEVDQWEQAFKFFNAFSDMALHSPLNFNEATQDLLFDATRRAQEILRCAKERARQRLEEKKAEQ
jgi:hypothetical protein